MKITERETFHIRPQWLYSKAYKDARILDWASLRLACENVAVPLQGRGPLTPVEPVLPKNPMETTMMAIRAEIQQQDIDKTP